MIVLLLIHWFLYLLGFRGRISCGLFGYTGLKPANPYIIRLLGCLNISRGKDSAGIYTNKTLIKNLGSFVEGFSDVHIPVGKDTIVIGHTRSKSSGAANIDNCHPFGIKVEDDNVFISDNFTHIIAHNGTLDDVYKLRSENDLAYQEFDMDSKALGGALFKNGTKVLGEYKGAAALMYTDTHTDDLMIWSGAAGGEEERPIHYVPVISRGNIVGYYFSSLEDHLKVICDGKKIKEENIEKVSPNTLMTFTKNEITNIEVIERPKELSRNYNSYSSSYGQYPYNNGYYSRTNSQSSRSFRLSRSSSTNNTTKVLELPVDKKDKVNINEEHQLELDLYDKDGGNLVVQDKLFRYKRNGHLLDGIYKIVNQKIECVYTTLPASNSNIFMFREGYMVDTDFYIKKSNIPTEIMFNSLCPRITPFGGLGRVIYEALLFSDDFTFPITDIEIKCKDGAILSMYIPDIVEEDTQKEIEEEVEEEIEIEEEVTISNYPKEWDMADYYEDKESFLDKAAELYNDHHSIIESIESEGNFLTILNLIGDEYNK